MTNTMQMYDAAYPPAHPPAWPVVAGYLGGNTPHAWTPAEWAHQPARYRLPIWVRSNPASVDAARDTAAAVAAARALKVPKGATIALDVETAVHPVYVRAFTAAMTAAGYGTILYGSASTAEDNPKPTQGYWIADWTGTPHMHMHAAATQYTNDAKHPGYDSSQIAVTVPLWDSHPTPKPPAKPPATTAPSAAAAQLVGQVWLTDGVLPVPHAWTGATHMSPAGILEYGIGLLREIQASLPK